MKLSTTQNVVTAVLELLRGRGDQTKQDLHVMVEAMGCVGINSNNVDATTDEAIKSLLNVGLIYEHSKTKTYGINYTRLEDLMQVLS